VHSAVRITPEEALRAKACVLKIVEDWTAPPPLFSIYYRTVRNPTGSLQLTIRTTSPSLRLVTVFQVHFISMASLIGSPLRDGPLSLLVSRAMRTVDKHARVDSHCKFMASCIKEGVVPRGCQLRFGFAALPPNPELHKSVKNLIHETNLKMIQLIRDAFICTRRDTRLKMDQTFLDIFHNTLDSQDSYWKTKTHILSYQKTKLAKYKNIKCMKLQKLLAAKKTSFMTATNAEDVTHERPINKVKKNRRFRRHSKALDTHSNTENVVNISSVELSEEQVHVLSLGDKFCPTPRSLDQAQLLLDVHEGCRRIRLREYFSDQVHENDTVISKFYKKTYWEPPCGRDVFVDSYCERITKLTKEHATTNTAKNNLTRRDRRALAELRQLVLDRKIRISPADKGGAIVVQDVSQYIQEAERQLADHTHYKKCDRDPTPQITTLSNNLIKVLHQEKHIDDNTFKWAKLDHANIKTHYFHLLPKIHKDLQVPPGRPIVSGIGGPTETLSKLVDFWLRPLTTTLPSFVQDSTHMLRILDSWNATYAPFNVNTRLVTLDVTSLYTNIPHEDMEEALLHFMIKHESATRPPSDTVIKAARHVLANNYFLFEGQCYKQIQGTAMGTPMAPTGANLFMGLFEERLLADCPWTVSPDRWKRYLDDIFLLWTDSDDDLNSFFTWLNSRHSSIQFTMNNSSTTISFLDLQIHMKDGFLCSDLFQKPTDSHSYLHFSSCHPLHCRVNIPFGQFLRLRRVCSSQATCDKRCKELFRYFRSRGYPTKTIQS